MTEAQVILHGARYADVGGILDDLTQRHIGLRAIMHIRDAGTMTPDTVVY